MRTLVLLSSPILTNARRKTELVETISAVLNKGALTVVESQKLRGRMQFMDGQLFGRLGRLCMRAITDHASAKKQAKLGRSTRDALERFLIFLEHAKPRQLHANSGKPWFIYTDACYEPKDTSWPCGLGGEFIRGSRVILLHLFVGPAHVIPGGRFKEDNYI